MIGRLEKKNVIERLINTAEKEIGYLEKASEKDLDSFTANAGSENYTKYWRDVKPEYQGQPWCAAFVTWVFDRTFGRENTKKLLKHYPYVYCPDLGNRFTKYANPKAGDVVIFWRNGTFAHTGIVTAVSGDRFETIEGNTSGASGIIPNGGVRYSKSGGWRRLVLCEDRWMDLRVCVREVHREDLEFLGGRQPDSRKYIYLHKG